MMKLCQRNIEYLMIKLHDNSIRTLNQWISSYDQKQDKLESTLFRSESTQSISRIDQVIAIPTEEKPWDNNARYFTKVKLSNVACLKILSHSIEGGNIEVMGMLLGNISDETIIVKNCYALPVEGTETRVNAQIESYEYMVQYLNILADRDLNIVGWYHSHPGYGCWLSGIDIQTQKLNQRFQDPYLAIVIDPKKTLTSKRVEIGAFRTIQSSKNDNHVTSIDTHEQRDQLEYYPLDIEIFGSQFDYSLENSRLNVSIPPMAREQELELFDQLLESIKAWGAFRTQESFKKMNESTFNPSHSELCKKSVESITGFDMNNSNLHSKSNSIISLESMDDENDVATDRGSISSTVSEYIHLPLQTPPLIHDPGDGPVEHSPIHIIEKEYYLYKKKLELLKAKEYEKLRFYKDTFTL